MVYELALILRPEVPDNQIINFQKLVNDCLKEYQGEPLLEDDWGAIELAQKLRCGVKRGRFLYFIFRAPTNTNVELLRRLSINESVVRSMIANLGEDREATNIVKNF